MVVSVRGLDAIRGPMRSSCAEAGKDQYFSTVMPCLKGLQGFGLLAYRGFKRLAGFRGYWLRVWLSGFWGLIGLRET